MVVTRYGSGGNYDADDRAIMIRVASGGKFKGTYRDPLETIVHEMMHLGIEEKIVKKFKLTHWEKERVVDQICQKEFKDIFPAYKLQEYGDQGADLDLSLDDLQDLPAAVSEYVISRAK